MTRPERPAPRDGIGGFLRPSRHRPPGHSATADTAQGKRTRRDLPGPPGEVHTARIATDTWVRAGVRADATANPDEAPPGPARASDGPVDPQSGGSSG